MPPVATKLLTDIPILGGLQQKMDSRKLPIGSSGAAVNLVPNKQGRLDKRLGFAPLPSTDPLGLSLPFTQGVALGTWNENLLEIGRYAFGGVTTSQLKSYSDDLGGPIGRGPVPDVKIATDSLLANTLACATSVTTAGFADVQVFAWIATGANASTAPYKGQVFWTAIERSTGNVLVAPSEVSANSTDAHFVRLALVPPVVGPGHVPTFVLCHDTAATAGTIRCLTMTLTQLETGLGWSNQGAIITTNTAQNGAFDMRAVQGDTANFVMAWHDNGTAVVCDQRPIATPGTPTTTLTIENTTNTPTGFGIRADTSLTQRLIVAYALEISASPYVVKAASLLYPSMISSKGTAVIYTGGGNAENPPTWLDVTFSSASASGTPTWTISHSPDQSAWNALIVSTGVYQTSGLFLSTGPGLPALNDSRIIQNLIFEGTSSNMQGNGSFSGTSAEITPGLVLASRGVEVNGIAYFLGWVPSATQGSFVILAQDFAVGTSGGVGPSSPMRPVGTLQTRTALAYPGTGPGTANATPAPNSWTGGSEWTLLGDSYGSACVGYIGGTQGQRLQPAYGLVETAPTTGYSMVQWGTMTAIGGALPCIYDGQNVFEQGFLYVPESIIAVVAGASSSGVGPIWGSSTDAASWIFTWEQFDAQGNFHLSARSTPLTITGADLVALGGITLPFQAATAHPIAFHIPTLGATMRQFPPEPAGQSVPGPLGPVKLGAYRTQIGGQVFLRIRDRFFNGADPLFPDMPANPTSGTTSVVFTDSVSDASLVDGTHPDLYGDGSTGAPGNLDNLNPPSTNLMVRHKERLFVAKGNVVQYSKGLSQLVGPSYDDQIKLFTVGGSDPVIGMASMDDKLVILKQNENFYVSGDGPADDGSGALFASPQPIPTDVGCTSGSSVISTPEGVYYLSTAGLRLITRALAVQYVGGPVEDEIGAFPSIAGATLYPQNNRVLFLANQRDFPSFGRFVGELLVRDYFLDVWTTAVMNDGGNQKGFVSAAVATAQGVSGLTTFRKPALHLLTADGTIWREHFPTDTQPYFDNATYISTIWLSPMLTLPAGSNNAASMQGRFRLYDILALIHSADPHGLIISVGTDYGTPGQNRTWVWNSSTGAPSIAPGGTVPTPEVQLRTYHGQMGEAFQIQIQDVEDDDSVTGQGAQLVQLTTALGVYPGPYKLPPSATQ
jgi:hypothetical protein